MSITTIRKYAMVALSVMGSAILLFSCGGADGNSSGADNEALMTERSEHLTILMSENGRRSYHFKTPLLEGYTLASDPYREFREGIHITTYQDDSLTTVNATLVANYAIYYEKRELWEAKGDVVVEKADGTKLYTQQLFWNSKTGRIYSNVDSKIVKGTDAFMGEGFESDEELKDWRFRRMSGKMLVNMEPTENPDSAAMAEKENKSSKDAKESKSATKTGRSEARQGAKSQKSQQQMQGGATSSAKPAAAPMLKSVHSNNKERNTLRRGDRLRSASEPGVQRKERLGGGKQMQKAVQVEPVVDKLE